MKNYKVKQINNLIKSIALFIAICIIIISLVVSIICILAFALGYRPVKTETSVIDFNSLAIIISILSVIVAIYIPCKIADKQNKIALFEKRYELYQCIKLILILKKCTCDIQDFTKAPVVKNHIYAIITTKEINPIIQFKIDKDNSLVIIHCVHKQLVEIRQCDFLFDENIFLSTQRLCKSYSGLITSLINLDLNTKTDLIDEKNKIVNDKNILFLQEVDLYKKEVLPKIEQFLKIE